MSDVAEDRCQRSKHVNGVSHGWAFDGDDPYIICAWCDEMRDALNGRVIRPGVTPPRSPQHGG